MPGDPRLDALEAEMRRQGAMLDQMYAVIVGPPDGTRPGLAEIARQYDQRIKSLERLPAWVAGIGTAIVTALGGAWAAANVHIGGTPPGGTP